MAAFTANSAPAPFALLEDIARLFRTTIGHIANLLESIKRHSSYCVGSSRYQISIGRSGQCPHEDVAKALGHGVGRGNTLKGRPTDPLKSELACWVRCLSGVGSDDPDL